MINVSRWEMIVNKKLWNLLSAWKMRKNIIIAKRTSKSTGSSILTNRRFNLLVIYSDESYLSQKKGLSSVVVIRPFANNCLLFGNLYLFLYMARVAAVKEHSHK